MAKQLEKNKKRASLKIGIHKLNTKFLIGFVLLALLICTASCTIGYLQYKAAIEKMYNDNAYSVAKVALSYVNGDDIARYLETLTIDDAYKEMQKKLNQLRVNMNVNYIYIAKVNETTGTDFIYVFDADNEEDNLETIQLGETGPFNPAFKEDVHTIVTTGKKVSNYFYSHSQYGYNSSAIVPVYDSSNNIVAILTVEVSLRLLQNTLFQYILYAVTATIFLVCLFLFVYLTYLNRKVITPLKNIAIHASNFVQSNSKLSEGMKHIKTGDEIETLATSLIKMEQDIHNYINHLATATADKEHIAAELDVAKQIQYNLFPCIFPAFPERTDFDIYAKLNSAKSAGGNFYNFFLVNKNQLCLVMGDASGSGIPTAMFSVIASTLIKNYANMGYEPNRVLSEVNNQLSQKNNAELTVATFLGIINLSDGNMTYASAGEIQALIKRSDNEFDVLDCKKCFHLGTMEQVPYTQQELSFMQGDILFLYTQGLANTTDHRGNLYSNAYVREHMNEIIKQYFFLEHIGNYLYEDIENFKDGMEQEDDSSILLFRYLGN